MKVFKVVKFADVETWSLQGWEFVMVVTQSLAQTVPCSTPFLGRDINYGPQYASRDEIVQVHEALFMLSKDGEEISREAVLEGKLNLAVAEGRKLQEQLNVMTHNYKVVKEDGAEYQKRYDQLNQKLGEEQKLRRKLEDDLAKICSAIGQIAFDKAVGR
jgi:hypothetical protein